ncbi:MAG: hypothetical protein RIF46_07915 [Cyclobacteriaceae bacterium]
MNIPYHSGHPWYYVLGGKTLSVREIQKEAKESGYKGYLKDDITKIRGDNEKLRRLKSKVKDNLKKDISIYRKNVFALHQFNRVNKASITKPVCEDVHLSVSLKMSHLTNGFAHLNYIDELLSQQPDLFDLL